MVFRTLDTARRTFMDAAGSRWISNGIYSSYTLFFRPLVPLIEVYDILIKFFLTNLRLFGILYLSKSLSSLFISQIHWLVFYMIQKLCILSF